MRVSMRRTYHDPAPSPEREKTQGGGIRNGINARSHCVRLYLWVGLHEGWETLQPCFDGREPWVGFQSDSEAASVVQLRHQAEVREAHLIADAERPAMHSDEGIHGFEAFLDPASTPGPGLLRAQAEIVPEPLHGPEILQRLDSAVDDLRELPDPGTRYRIGGKEGRTGMPLLDVFQDGHRLGKGDTIFEQHRHLPHRIHRPMFRPVLCPPIFDEMDRDGLVGEPLPVQRDADPP